MNKYKLARNTIAALIIMVSYPQETLANSLKGNEFLKWKADTQSFFMSASVGMAVLIASSNDQKQAKCIDDWYFKDTTSAAITLKKAIQQYPDYHPRGVILAVLQKRCGPFKYR